MLIRAGDSITYIVMPIFRIVRSATIP